ncbi:GH3 auxin-responsive promoter [candidate division KSB1 bacterium]|nr:GH3 auxin-responsive promoter [candidate division KSB1 bacterium]
MSPFTHLASSEELWNSYCTFLDLNLADFMDIQLGLFKENLPLLTGSKIGKKIIGQSLPRSLEEFRQSVPTTTYSDYAALLTQKDESCLPAPVHCWAHTSGRSGTFKWIPITRKAYETMGKRALASLFLSTIEKDRQITLRPHDVAVYNTPPPPYLSGIIGQAVSDEFPLRVIPPFEVSKTLSFHERIEQGFKTALISRLDILGSIAVVLAKMGEHFAKGTQKKAFSWIYFHPVAMARILRAMIRCRREQRPMLPKDLWTVKGIPTGGTDTAIYRDKLKEAWGVDPLEIYGSTEGGTVATQTWNRNGMIFFPDMVFLEFVPESEWQRWNEDSGYIPKTHLLNEVELGTRYEILYTSLHGQPLMRYRINDVIRFTRFQDEEANVALPHFEFISRTHDFIDLAGFTGLIDEKTVWKAIENSQIPYIDWTIRKESHRGDAVLHLYIEPTRDIKSGEIERAVHKELALLNPFYADYAAMICSDSLRVTVLKKGAFMNYIREKQAQGADLAHLKPAHMNPTDSELNVLLDHPPVD